MHCDPDQYLRFTARRALPFHHLVEAIEFMAEYAEQLREAYPDRADKTVFPFRMHICRHVAEGVLRCQGQVWRAPFI